MKCDLSKLINRRFAPQILAILGLAGGNAIGQPISANLAVDYTQAIDSIRGNYGANENWDPTPYLPNSQHLDMMKSAGVNVIRGLRIRLNELEPNDAPNGGFENNLLLNGSIENGQLGWNKLIPEQGIANIEDMTTGGHNENSKKCLSITNIAVNQQGSWLSDPISVQAGSSYTLEAWAKGVFTYWGNADINIFWYDANGVNITGVQSSRITPNDWTLMRIQGAIAPANAVTARVSLRLNYGENSSKVYFDDITFLPANDPAHGWSVFWSNPDGSPGAYSLDAAHSHTGNHSLMISGVPVDKQGRWISSSISIDNTKQYIFSAWSKGQNWGYWGYSDLQLIWLDQNGWEIRSDYSNHVSSTFWSQLTIGPVTPPATAVSAKLLVRLNYGESSIAWFDDVAFSEYDINSLSLSRYDSIILPRLRKGFQVIPCLHGSPDWLASQFGNPDSPPKSGSQYDTEWGRISAEIIKHYNDLAASNGTIPVYSWDIWNEPDANSESTGWGYGDRLVQFATNVFPRIRQTNPSAKLGLNLMTHSDYWMSKIIAGVAGLDFISWHHYYPSGDESWLPFDYLENGNFLKGMQGWSTFGAANGVYCVITNGAQSGLTNAISISNIGVSEQGFVLSNRIPISAANKYDLSAKVKGVFSYWGNLDLGVYWYDINGVQIGGNQAPRITPTSWQIVTLDSLAPPANAVAARVFLRLNYGELTSIAQFCDVSFQLNNGSYSADEALLDQTSLIGVETGRTKALVQSSSSTAKSFLGEFNVSTDPSIANQWAGSTKGAVWCASALKHALYNGIEMAPTWYEAMGMYGFLGIGSGSPGSGWPRNTRPVYGVFDMLYNQGLFSSGHLLYRATSDTGLFPNPLHQKLEIMATKSSIGRYDFVIINKDLVKTYSAAVTLTLPAEITASNGTVTVYHLDASTTVDGEGYFGPTPQQYSQLGSSFDTPINGLHKVNIPITVASNSVILVDLRLATP